MEERQQNAFARRQKFRCALTCWGLAGFAAVVILVVAFWRNDWGFIQAVFAAGVVFAVAGTAGTLLFCRPLPGPVQPGSAGRPPGATPGRSEPPREAPPTGVGPAPPPPGALEDLQRIRGIGPKLAQTLLDSGVTGVAGIARWSEADVTWWDDKLEGFRGRVSRDNWVEQASALLAQDAAGGVAARKE